MGFPELRRLRRGVGERDGGGEGLALGGGGGGIDHGPQCGVVEVLVVEHGRGHVRVWNCAKGKNGNGFG